MNKNELVINLMSRGVLISPDFIDNLSESENFEEFFKDVIIKSKFSPLVINKEFYDSFKLKKPTGDINWLEFERAKVSFEKNKDDGDYDSFVSLLNARNKKEVDLQIVVENKDNFNMINNNEGTVNIVDCYEDQENFGRSVQDFVSYFKSRYELLRTILSSRPELITSISINRIEKKPQGEQISIIGMVAKKDTTKNGNFIINVEDPTGNINLLIMKNKPELFFLANDIVMDEVVGINGVLGKDIIYVNEIFFPEVPLNKEFKKAPHEGYVVFLSDIHFGLDKFIVDDFLKLVSWLNGNYGTEKQREIAKKVKYIFMCGDIVEGVGVYPGQESELVIQDIYDQYEEAAKYIRMIPGHIKIIINGGNHDAMRIAEPQPKFDKKICKSFYEIPNLTIVSNPALVNIHANSDFPGFDILMYHGYSFPYYSENVPSIKSKGGMERCDLIMKFLLQKRHLSPTHGSNLYVPDSRGDSLVIKKVPDFFISGHIHKIVASNYKNITLINSSCWVTQSEDNAKRGIVPHPAKVPIVDLQTREIKIMNFLSDENEKKNLIYSR